MSVVSIRRRTFLALSFTVGIAAFLCTSALAQTDPLPSWNDVHHTDAKREYASDRDSKFGKLDKALDEATTKGWAVVDMKRDWKTIFPSEKE